jgi:hypothetical protein
MAVPTVAGAGGYETSVNVTNGQARGGTGAQQPGDTPFAGCDEDEDEDDADRESAPDDGRRY